MAGSDAVNPSAARVELTYDDLMLFPDDGKRHELIDGEHYVSPSPNIGHQEILGRLHLLVGNWLAAHPIGRVYFAPLDVVFSTFDVVEPDLLYMSNERAAKIITPMHVHGVPELVVEIGSKGTRRRDRTTKRRLYERAGVSEYWFVDPEVEIVRVHRREADRFSRATEFSRKAGDVLTTSLLPGLDLELVRIFRAR